MAKKLVFWLFSFILFLNWTSDIHARVVAPEAGESARLLILEIENRPIVDLRARKLEYFISRRNAPLAGFAEVFVDTADKYGLDWRLVASISGVESNFGKRIPYRSYNAWGWANGEYRFESWDGAIDHVSMVLKEKYHDRGLVTPRQIGPVYAPPSSTWAGKVEWFQREIDGVDLPAESQLALGL